MDDIKVYLIKNSKGQFLRQGSTPRVNVSFGSVDSAEFFPTESQAFGFIKSCCTQNNAGAIIDCVIIEGQFVPKEGYKAIDEVLKNKRMKRLYDMMISELSISELLLFTSAPDRITAVKHPFFEKVQSAGLGATFDHITTQSNSWWMQKDADSAFEIFKKFAFFAMKNKAKEQQQ